MQVPKKYAAAVSAIQYQLVCAIIQAMTAGQGISAAWKAFLMSSWLLLGKAQKDADNDKSATELLDDRLFLYRMGQFQ